MVNNEHGLHSIERLIAESLADGRELQLSDVGGADAILRAQSHLVNARFLPEIFNLVFRDSPVALSPTFESFIVEAFRHIDRGPIVQACINVVDTKLATDPDLLRSLFDTFAERSLDNSLDGSTRTAFLEGCVCLTIRETSRRHSLIGHFLDFDISGMGHFKQRFVKMLGVCHSHWGCVDTEYLLRQLCNDMDCVAEANLELGLHHFGRLLGCVDQQEAKRQLSAAEERFRIAAEHASVHAEATIYRLGCRMVRDFGEGELSVTAGQIGDELDRSIVALHAYHRTDTDPEWLGSRTTELLYWRALYNRLRHVDFELDRAAWFDPSELIVSSLVPIYLASQTLLARDEHGGIETLLQPRVVCTIARNPGHLENLTRWLELNPDHELSAEASTLIEASKAEFALKEESNFIWGRVTRDRAVAVFSNDDSKADPEVILLQVYAAAASLHMRQLNANHQKVILKCIEAVQNHPDYGTADVQKLFGLTLLMLVCYIDSRLNLTKKHEPMVEFLFRRSDGKRAKEEKLQSDFVAFIKPFLLGTEIEVEDIGAGRADIFLRCNAERMTCEVKRDDKDCNFDSLMEKYSDQTIQYQNSSSRISFMLVLDQTNRGGRALHLSESIRPMQTRLDEEEEPRHVIVCLVSGDRLRPSDLSKQSRIKRLS